GLLAGGTAPEPPQHLDLVDRAVARLGEEHAAGAADAGGVAHGGGPRSAPERGEHLGGRPLPALDGAVDVAGPPLGGLGPGPVDAANGDPQRRPVDGPGARRQVGAVAAPGPGLGRPVPVDVVADVAGPLAERAGEHVDDHVAALLPGPGAGGDGGGALEEPGDDAGRA